MESRTKYIGTGATATIVGLIVWFFLSSNFSVEVSGDAACAGTYDEPCEAYYNITSTNFIYYIYNKDKVNLNFIPEVKSSYSCKKDNRFTSKARENRELYPCGVGYREFDWKTPLTNKSSYVEKFEKGKKQEYKLVVFKFNSTDEIKWGGEITGESIDPIFFGVYNITLIQDCHIEQEIKEIKDYQNYNFLDNGTFCLDFPVNKTCIIKNLNNYTMSQIVVYNQILNTSICRNVGLQVDDKKINWERYGWECKRNLFEITCDSQYQSNMDGICQSGERCVKIDIRDLSNIKEIGYSPTKQIRSIEIEK